MRRQNYLLQLASSSCKGKKTLKVNLKSETISDEDIAKFLLGPTGNLRHTTMVLGKNSLLVLIRFDEEIFG